MVSVGVIIPFRGLGSGKTRLRAALPGASVDALIECMLANVVRAVRGALPRAPVLLMTKPGARGANVSSVDVAERPLGLNDALEWGRAQLAARSVDRILVLPSDLPLIQPADVDALLAGVADVVVAPDAKGQGTNGLVFPAAEQEFCRFGAESARRHAEEAVRRGLTIGAVRTARLARDVDTIDDIDAAVCGACAPWAMRPRWNRSPGNVEASASAGSPGSRDHA